MRKIINGKKYDTDTAEWIADYYICNGSFQDFSENLYRKKTGEFFFYAEGNAGSDYAKKLSDGTRAPGREIIPLTDKQAREWVEKYCSVSKYEEIFGGCKE